MRENSATSAGQTSTLRDGLRRRFVRAAGIGATALIIAGGIGGGIAGLHWRAGAVPAADPQPPVTVATTVVSLQSRYDVEHRYVGRLEAARTTRIAFERPGLVTEVAVDEGDRVDAGHVLARLDTEPVQTQRRRLVAERARVEARLAFARQTLDRRRSLAGQAVSRQRFDEVRFEAEALKAEIESINARIAARDIDIEKSTLTAPFAGTIAERSVDEGAVVAAGSTVVRLLETGRMQARIGLPPDVATTLTPGAIYDLTAEGRSLSGSLVALRPDLETGTRTVVALFDVPRADDDTRLSGDLVELALTRSIAAEGTWLPLSALSEGQKGLWTVFAAVGEGNGARVDREAVQVIHVAGSRAFVRGTFAEGARIVASGTNRLTPGQRVRVRDRES